MCLNYQSNEWNVWHSRIMILSGIYLQTTLFQCSDNYIGFDNLQNYQSKYNSVCLILNISRHRDISHRCNIGDLYQSNLFIAILQDVSMALNYMLYRYALLNSLIVCEIALRGKPLDLTDVESTMVQVMAWCHVTNVALRDFAIKIP